MTRRFKREWKDRAAQYARQSWHTREYRYWHIDSQSKIELAETAMAWYRAELNAGYRQLVAHPKSRKATERITEAARTLASIALYLTEQDNAKQNKE